MNKDDIAAGFAKALADYLSTRSLFDQFVKALAKEIVTEQRRQDAEARAEQARREMELMRAKIALQPVLRSNEFEKWVNGKGGY
jgi:hypothetical protein